MDVRIPYAPLSTRWNDAGLQDASAAFLSRKSKFPVMEYEITWGGDPEDASLTTWGRATIEALDAWVQEVLSDPRYRPGMRVLIDHSRLDWSGLTPTDIHQRIELFAKEAARVGHVSAALVMHAPVDFGVARMEQAYIELHPEVQIDLGVFFSVEEAREWLRAQPKPDPQAGS